MMSATAFRIGDVAEIVRGVTYKKPQALTEPAPGHLPLLRATNIGRSLDFLNLLYVPDSVVKEEQRLRPGDIVLAASSGSLGVVGKAAGLKTDWEGTFGAFCYVVRPDPILVRSRYLELFMQSPRYRKRVSQLAAGTNINNLKREHIESFELPAISLGEQDALVAEVDKQFTRLDAALTAIHRAGANLSRYRAAVLKGSAEGDWEHRRMDEISLLVTDGDHNPPKRVPQGIPHLTAKHVKRRRLLTEGTTFISEEDFERTRERYEPRQGDLIITCVGTVGETAVVPRGMVFSADRNLAAVRLNEQMADPSFIQLVLSAPHWRKMMAGASGSTAQPHLYLRDLRAITVPVPPVETQRSIVVRLERELSVIEALEASIGSELKHAEILKRTILERTLSGHQPPTADVDLVS